MPEKHGGSLYPEIGGTSSSSSVTASQRPSLTAGSNAGSLHGSFPTAPSTSPPSRGNFGASHHSQHQLADEFRVHVFLRPEFQLTPRPRLSPDDIPLPPLSPLHFEFDLERKILAEAEQKHPGLLLQLDAEENSVSRFCSTGVIAPAHNGFSKIDGVNVANATGVRMVSISETSNDCTRSKIQTNAAGLPSASTRRDSRSGDAVSSAPSHASSSSSVPYPTASFSPALPSPPLPGSLPVANPVTSTSAIPAARVISPSPPASSQFSRLAAKEEDVLNKYKEMGLDAEVVVLGLCNFGDQKDKIVEFCSSFSTLKDMGFSSEAISTALMMFDNDFERTVAHLAP